VARLQLEKDQPFSLDITLSCGQVFRWERGAEGWWRGIAGNRVIRIRQDRSTLVFKGADRKFIEHYFSLDHDLNEITGSFDRDPVIHAAIIRCRGLRLIRQPPWECLISYICATNSNIPMIKRRIENIAERLGPRIHDSGEAAFGFPDSAALAGSCTSILTECRMGYRGQYVQKTACEIRDTGTWVAQIESLPYEDAREALMLLQGVGPKAADCILLFAFEKFESFPVDVWIRRIMHQHYLPKVSPKGSLTTREYNTIRRFAAEYFGSSCGYAQEYLYAAYGPGNPLHGGEPDCSQ
jgi:N-glycosylase/DNA lyase